MKTMSKGRCGQVGIAVFLILGLCAVAEAQTTHSITVDVDETTAGDLSLIADFMSYAAPGSEVSKSLRRIVMAAVGEITLATNARIDGVGVLTLDDGSIVALGEGDTIQAKPCTPGDDSCAGGVGPVFSCENGQEHCKPVCVCHPTGGSLDNKCMAIPPKEVTGVCKVAF